MSIPAGNHLRRSSAKLRITAADDPQGEQSDEARLLAAWRSLPASLRQSLLAVAEHSAAQVALRRPGQRSSSHHQKPEAS